jgi:hypothetical protein
MDYASFHIGYDGGQRLFFGSDQSLILELEAVGGGLDPSPPWNNGGPLLLRRNSSPTRIVGWMRGTSGRSNAWEAWGVLLPVSVDLTYWPWYASWLDKPDKMRLSAFSETISGGAGPAATVVLPPSTAGIVTAAYTNDARDATARVQMYDPGDALAMPWLWLLGPRSPSEATIGPPRYAPVVLGLPLSYEPLIAAGYPSAREKAAPYITQTISLLTRGRVDLALDAVAQLRSLPPEERRDRILETIHDVFNRSLQPSFPEQEPAPVRNSTPPLSLPPSKKPAKTPEQQNASPAAPVPKRTLDLTRLRLDIIIGLLVGILVVNVIGLRREWSAVARTDTVATATDATDRDHGAPPMSSGTVSATAAATDSVATVATADCDFNDQAQRADLIGRLKTHVAQLTSVSPKLAFFADAAVQNWDDQRKQNIATAARQLFLREMCGKQLVIDGVAGPKSTQPCTAAEWEKVRTNTDAALSWLCRRLKS